MTASLAKAPLFIRLMVLRKILLLNDGRDKVLKVVQYASKTILYLSLISKLKKMLSLPDTHPLLLLPSRLEKLVPHLSLARKIVRLAHGLESLDTIASLNISDLDKLSEKRLETGLMLLNALIGLVNDISDDCICLAKMEVLEKVSFYNHKSRFVNLGRSISHGQLLAPRFQIDYGMPVSL
jgi:hypothetical protein